MNKSRKENIDKPSLKDTDSAFIGINNLSESLDLGGLFSHQFTNITPVYSSSHGPTEIYSATRYGKRFILKGLKEQYRNDPIYTIALAKEFEIGITLEHHGISVRLVSRQSATSGSSLCSNMSTAVRLKPFLHQAAFRLLLQEL